MKISGKFLLLPAVLACLGLQLIRPEANADETKSALSESDSKLAQALIGSWRIIEAHRDGVPSELHYTAVTIKHITPTQFLWLSYKPDDRKIFRSMGGSWTVKNGVYLETPQYATREDFVDKGYGNVTRIECEIKGDIFTQTIVGKDGSRFVEVWKRMKPGEDSSEIPQKN